MSSVATTQIVVPVGTTQKGFWPRAFATCRMVSTTWKSRKTSTKATLLSSLNTFIGPTEVNQDEDDDEPEEEEDGKPHALEPTSANTPSQFGAATETTAITTSAPFQFGATTDTATDTSKTLTTSGSSNGFAMGNSDTVDGLAPGIDPSTGLFSFGTELSTTNSAPFQFGNTSETSTNTPFQFEAATETTDSARFQFGAAASNNTGRKRNKEDKNNGHKRRKVG